MCAKRDNINMYVYTNPVYAFSSNAGEEKSHADDAATIIRQ